MLSLVCKRAASFCLLSLPSAALTSSSRTRLVIALLSPARRLPMSTTVTMPHDGNGDSGGGTIGVVQMRCTGDKAANFAQARGYILQARERGARLVFLPECTDYIGESVADTLRLAESLDDEGGDGGGGICAAYRQLAREAGVWLSIGSLHLKQSTSGEAADSRISNSHLMIDASGDIVGRYDKAHMFDVQVPTSGGPAFVESRYTRPGAALGPVVATPAGRVGLAVCYDLRFAEVSVGLRERGAEVLTFPSAFTVPTGQAHWEALLRARAIESQCWVVAAAQVGAHSLRRHSYGHSVIVDPWGKVQAELDGQSPGLLIGRIDLAYLAKVRAGMPVMQQRRYDIYPSVAGSVQLVPIPDSVDFTFGPHCLPSSRLFCLTRLSYATVNLRPIRPHHVLVCPIRRVPGLSDLTPVERADLLGLAELVGSRLRRHAGTDSCSFSLQDGPLAGQTVPHVHVHVLPRQAGDFRPNDAVYAALEAPDEEEEKDESLRRPDRSPEAMVKEAAEFRSLFYS